MWKFRATYPVPELGVLEGDLFTIDEDLAALLIRELSPDSLRPLIRHLSCFERYDGASLHSLLSALSEPSRRHRLRLLR